MYVCNAHKQQSDSNCAKTNSYKMWCGLRCNCSVHITTKLTGTRNKFNTPARWASFTHDDRITGWEAKYIPTAISYPIKHTKVACLFAKQHTATSIEANASKCTAYRVVDMGSTRANKPPQMVHSINVAKISPKGLWWLVRSSTNAHAYTQMKIAASKNASHIISSCSRLLYLTTIRAEYHHLHQSCPPSP